MLSPNQQKIKRVFDLLLVLICIPVLCIPLVLLVIFSSIDTLSFGVFSQQRVGIKGTLFTLFKIKTMYKHTDGHVVVTSFGSFLRKSKFDELPQLFNVLIGEMSFVGPRPDISGYADKLNEADSIILSVKPGITGPATLKFSDEEELLANQEDPLKYNDTVIWPQKVALNRVYVQEWSLTSDIKYLWLTFKSILH